MFHSSCPIATATNIFSFRFIFKIIYVIWSYIVTIGKEILTLTNFCRFDELKVDEKLRLATINIIEQAERHLISKFDKLNFDDSYRFVKFSYVKISLCMVAKAYHGCPE